MGMDLGAKQGAALFKAYKFDIFRRFVIDRAFQVKGRTDIWGAGHAGCAGTQIKTESHKAEQNHLFFRVTGEKPPDNPFPDLRSKTAKPCGNAAGLNRIGGNVPRTIKSNLTPFRRPDAGGNLPAGKALKNTAKKALKRAVIAVHLIGHICRVRHCSASCLTSLAAWQGSMPQSTSSWTAGAAAGKG